MLIPGPVNVPKSVAMKSTIVMNHRSDRFRKVVGELEELMRKHFGASRVSLLTGSGTLACRIHGVFTPEEGGEHYSAKLRGVQREVT